MRNKAHLFDTELAELAEKAKALSHPARLEILRVLAAREECICDEVVGELPLAQATVSRHLKVLKEAGFIRGTIEGPRMCYCLAPNALRTMAAQMGGFFNDLNVADASPNATTNSTCC